MRAAIYVRVSTPKQSETQTIEQQISQLKAHIEDQSWLLEADHIYRDDGYSGANLNRPGLDSLRDRAALVEFDVVLVTAPDRLSRNYVHQMLLLEEFDRYSIRVEFLERPMSDDPHDRLLLQIRSAVAEYERTLIGERMRRGRLMKYRAGQLLPWGRRPYGYCLDPERPRDPAGVRLDEAEAALVAEMFAWYLESDGTLYRVAKRLNELGVRTPMGKQGWHTSTIRGILTNPAYTGTAYANRLRSVPAKQRQSALRRIGRGLSTVLKPKEEWIPIPVPAIVTEEVFERVQEKLSQNQQAASRNNKRHHYLLRGRVSCGHCRLSARGRTLNSKYHYYVCHGRISPLHTFREQPCTARYAPAAQLDELVWQDLCQVLTDPEVIAHALERAHGGHWVPQELQARLKNLEVAEKQLAQQQERLLRAYLAGIVELAEFERKRKELTHKQEILNQQAAQLKATTVQRTELGENLTSIEAFCQQVRPRLEKTSFAQRRQLVELLIDRVIVTNEVVEIRYVIPTQPDGPHTPFCHLRTDYRPVAFRVEGHYERSGTALAQVAHGCRPDAAG
jgi:site-specific DNA recombinase